MDHMDVIAGLQHMVLNGVCVFISEESNWKQGLQIRQGIHLFANEMVDVVLGNL